MEKIIRSIVRQHGGYREKEIMKNPHLLEKDETWNEFHKVVNVLKASPDPDGYRSGFAVDLVTMSICG